MAVTQITTWFLEMTSPDQLRPGRAPRQDAVLTRVGRPCPEFSRFFYRAVGGSYYWIDRIEWTYEQWQTWAEQVETWAAYVDGTPAGYFELQDRRVGEGSVNIALFGLLPWAIGQGIGGWLLTRAVERAWELRPRMVTVNTCSVDGPHALANYQARGFTIARIYTGSRDLPDPPGPWRGARSQGAGAGSREAGAGSREPGAGSREPGAGSREPGVRSREPGAGSQEQLVGRPALIVILKPAATDSPG